MLASASGGGGGELVQGGLVRVGSGLGGVWSGRGVWSGGCAWSRGGGVPGPGGSGLGGGGVWSQGGLVRGVCLVWGVVCLVQGGLASQHALRQTPLWTESQTPVKTLPWPNFVAAGKNLISFIRIYFTL